MSTLALNSDNDIYFDDSGKLVFIQGTNSDKEILQRIKVRLRFFKGEWFLNTDHGLPYFDNILGTKPLNLNILESIFRTQILDVEGVKSILESTIDYDGNQRKILYNFKAVSINNTSITSNVEI